MREKKNFNRNFKNDKKRINGKIHYIQQQSVLNYEVLMLSSVYILSSHSLAINLHGMSRKGLSRLILYILVVNKLLLLW